MNLQACRYSLARSWRVLANLQLFLSGQQEATPTSFAGPAATRPAAVHVAPAAPTTSGMVGEAAPAYKAYDDEHVPAGTISTLHRPPCLTCCWWLSE